MALPQRFGTARGTEVGDEGACAGPNSQAPDAPPPAQPHLDDMWTSKKFLMTFLVY